MLMLAGVDWKTDGEDSNEKIERARDFLIGVFSIGSLFRGEFDRILPEVDGPSVIILPNSSNFLSQEQYASKDDSSLFIARS